MSKPNLTIQVEPFNAGNAEYLPLAPTTADGTPMLKIVLRLQLTNNEASMVTVTGITFSFPRSSQPAMVMQDVNSYGNLGIAAGTVEIWSNGFSHTDININNAIYLTGAAPPQVKIDLFCEDATGKAFSEPATITLPLAPHKSPVPGDAYLFPYSFDDLRPNEYMITSALHPSGNGAQWGTQIFAHDIGCIGWDSNAKAWSPLLPGGDKTKNEDYRIYGKPVRAMAAGTVFDSVDGIDDNPVAGNYPDPPAADGAGNHITITYGTENVTYFHFQKNSIPANLRTDGTPVSEGQLLGLVGNTGHSSAPHTHIECERASDNALRPLPFRNAWVIDETKLSPPGAVGPWFKLKGHGISKNRVSVWPLARNPEWLGWQDLGGIIKAPPAVASLAPHRLDVFSVGTDGKLAQKSWDGSKWSDWISVGGQFKGGPAAVSWGANRIDVFVRGSGDHLEHRFWNGKWNGWVDLGGPITSAPAVTSRKENHLDVFAAGSDGNLNHKWWDGAKWHAWENLGGIFKGAPGAVSWDANRIDVFVRGMNDHLSHRLWNGKWSGWEDLGGPISSAPAVCSWAPNRLDVFAAGSDGQLLHKWWDGSKWSDWEWVGGVFHDNPAAVSWGPNRIDVFVNGMDNHLGHLWRG